MAKKVLVVGGDKSPLLIQKFVEEFGKDVELYTPEEAQELGMTMEDFGNIPSYKITAPKLRFHPELVPSSGVYANGQSKRREKRKNSRK
jgi:hypothetical protein